MADKVVKLVSSRGFQDVGTIGQTTAQLSGNIQSINAVIDVGLRNTRNIGDSFVRVNDLVDMGIGTLDGNQFFVTPASGGLSTVNVQYSISGDGSVSTPLQLVNDTASPGANKVYGTDGSGVRGWQAASGGSSPLTTKGDLFGFDTADNRIPVGSNGKVLTADSTAAVGVSWQTPSGGGGTVTFVNANVDADAHPQTPSVFDDEFEGSILDPKWTWIAQGTSTATTGFGILTLTPQANGLAHAIYQVPGSSPWKFRAKFALNNPAASAGDIGGFLAMNSGTTEMWMGGFNAQAGNLQIYHFNPFSVFSGTIQAGVNPHNWGWPESMHFNYQELEWDGTNLHYRGSLTGNEGSFIEWFSGVPTFVPDAIGLFASSNSTPATPLNVDWFRQIPATGYVPATGIAPTFFNIGPDSHPITPSGVGFGPNDEFELNSGIDLAGARYTGATPWTAFSGGSASNSSGQGAIALVSSNGAANTQGYSQPIVGATWQYTCKIAANAANVIDGMFVSVAGGNQAHILMFGNQFYVQHRSNPTTFVSNAAGPANPVTVAPFYYLRITYNGTNVIYSFSSTGYDFDFTVLFTESIAAFLGAVPTLFGISSDANGGGTAATARFDWIRQTA